MDDIAMLAEMRVARKQLTQTHIQELVAHGVPSAIVKRYPLIGVDLVRVNGNSDISARDRTYEPDPNGVPAFITPVLIYSAASPEASGPLFTARFSGECVDLVAWSPAHPDTWATRKGAATWLGCIEPQFMEPDPVHIRRSPLSWLQAACVGMVVLTKEPAEAYKPLTSCHAIKAEDEEHAKELRKMVRQPWPLPRISASKDTMSKDTMSKDTMSKDTMSKDAAEHNGMDHA